MKKLHQIILPFVLCTLMTNCDGQSKQNEVELSNQQSVGGKFENREFTYYGIPKTISSSDTSSGWNLEGQKILVTGIVYQRDGKTPAPDVLLYYYQTNTDGEYVHKPDDKRSMPPNELGQTHGYLRGWVKTGSDGKYHIYTVRPGVYPTLDAPAHIHMTIKESNEIPEYYIDDATFDDDKLLTTAYRKKLENRCGSGILRLLKKESLYIGERNIILGLNIPNYPISKNTEILSGKEIGEDVFSFIPYHAWGPDKGSKTCPICKYGRYHGILYHVGNNPDWEDIKSWLKFLEAESIKREKYLKVYFIYGNSISFEHKKRLQELEKLGRELRLERTALTFVPSFNDVESDVVLNEINQDVSNTFILYKHVKIFDKYINLRANDENFKRIQESLDKSINEYFFLD